MGKFPLPAAGHLYAFLTGLGLCIIAWASTEMEQLNAEARTTTKRLDELALRYRLTFAEAMESSFVFWGEDIVHQGYDQGEEVGKLDSKLDEVRQMCEQEGLPIAECQLLQVDVLLDEVLSLRWSGKDQVRAKALKEKLTEAVLVLREEAAGRHAWSKRMPNLLKELLLLKVLLWCGIVLAVSALAAWYLRVQLPLDRAAANGK